MDDHDPLTYAIIGAAMEVHAVLGKGFLESVYQEAFALELRDRSIPFRQEVLLPIQYKETRLTTTYRCDFICYEDVVVELKAISTLTSADEAQLLNYLKAARIGRGLVINFGAASLQFKRRVFNWNG
jgi:GxxExxY protein